jgi:N-acylglucosamine 2-epimerase
MKDIKQLIMRIKGKKKPNSTADPESERSSIYPVTDRKFQSSTAGCIPCGNYHVPREIAGMPIEELRNDYRDRIFNQYLPFWEKGGVDNIFGGFMCELRDDGTVENDEKYIWYQGRGIWVYSFLHNNFGKGKNFLETANKSRDFLVNRMYLGKGKWLSSVNRQGNPVPTTVGQGSVKDIYGPLFAAAGFIELFKATGNESDLDIAKTTIWSAVKAYENENYEGIAVPYTDVKGLRTQGHSFVILWILTNLLSFYSDEWLRELQEEHINHIMNHFWNPEYGIVNEYLFHDYSRITACKSIMAPGHSLEALWMVMHEAIRRNDGKLFETAKNRIRRLIEMNWDYVFEGMATEEFIVFTSGGKCLGPAFDLKAMWAQTELLIATLSILEFTGETWSKEWYERGRNYCLKTMANTGTGVWRQAVDRFGNDKERPGISIYRKDNFHQIRYLMMNLLSLERMIKNNLKLSKLT